MYFKGVNRGLKVTFLGRVLIVLILSIGLLAISTGINALFIFLGFSLGTFMVSGVISEKNIKNILIKFKRKSYFTDENKTKVLNFSLYQEGKKFKNFSLIFQFFLKDPLKEKKYKGKDLKSNGEYRLNFSSIKEPVKEVFLKDFKRGVYTQLYLKTSTSFPFGFFEKYKFSLISIDLFVLPKIDKSLFPLWQDILNQLAEKKKSDDDFKGHESYRNNHNFKRLDWKKNASKDQSDWVVKKFDSQAKAQKVILKVEPFFLKSLSKKEFEIFLVNLRTGLFLLEKEGLTLFLDLEDYGCAKGFLEAYRLVASVKFQEIKTSQKTKEKGLCLYLGLRGVRFSDEDKT